jgi:predicted dehydrogenase
VQDQEDMEAALKAGQPELVVRNWMFANSIHVIDYLRQFGRGEIVDVTPSIPWNAEKPGFVVATVKFSSGDVGVYQGVWNAPGPWSVAITTAEKRLEMRPVEHLTVQPRGSRSQDKVELGTIDTDFKPGLRVQAQAAIDAAAGKPTSLATLEDATESMRLCARIFGLA